MITNINSFNLTTAKKLLLDANIWLPLFYPIWETPKNHDLNAIKFIESILPRKNIEIVLPCIVISEIINRIYRFHLSHYKQKNSIQNINLKDFRKLQEFNAATDDIAANIKSSIKKLGTRLDKINDGFDSFKFDDVFFSSLQNTDYNDLMLVEIYKNNNVDFFVTNDSDIFNYKEEINILTALTIN